MPRPSMLEEIEGYHYEPDDNQFKDKPQNWLERNVQIGKFWIKVDTVNLEWKNNCTFSFQTTMYVLEHTGADVPGGNSRYKIVDFILYTTKLHPVFGVVDENISKYDWGIYLLRLQPLVMPRDVRMAEWAFNGDICCKNLIEKR